MGTLFEHAFGHQLVHGLEEWQNIQEIIRVSFQMMKDEIVKQHSRSNRLENGIFSLRQQIQNLQLRCEQVQDTVCQKNDSEIFNDVSRIQWNRDDKSQPFSFAGLNRNQDERFLDYVALQEELQKIHECLERKLDRTDANVDEQDVKTVMNQSFVHECLEKTMDQSFVHKCIEKTIDHSFVQELLENQFLKKKAILSHDVEEIQRSVNHCQETIEGVVQGTNRISKKNLHPMAVEVMRNLDEREMQLMNQIRQDKIIKIDEKVDAIQHNMILINDILQRWSTPTDVSKIMNSTTTKAPVPISTSNLVPPTPTREHTAEIVKEEPISHSKEIKSPKTVTTSPLDDVLRTMNRKNVNDDEANLNFLNNSKSEQPTNDYHECCCIKEQHTSNMEEVEQEQQKPKEQQQQKEQQKEQAININRIIELIQTSNNNSDSFINSKEKKEISTHYECKNTTKERPTTKIYPSMKCDMEDCNKNVTTSLLVTAKRHQMARLAKSKERLKSFN